MLPDKQLLKHLEFFFLQEFVQAPFMSTSEAVIQQSRLVFSSLTGSSSPPGLLVDGFSHHLLPSPFNGRWLALILGLSPWQAGVLLALIHKLKQLFGYWSECWTWWTIWSDPALKFLCFCGGFAVIGQGWSKRHLNRHNTSHYLLSSKCVEWKNRLFIT